MYNPKAPASSSARVLPSLRGARAGTARFILRPRSASQPSCRSLGSGHWRPLASALAVLMAPACSILYVI